MREEMETVQLRLKELEKERIRNKLVISGLDVDH